MIRIHREHVLNQSIFLEMFAIQSTFMKAGISELARCLGWLITNTLKLPAEPADC